MARESQSLIADGPSEVKPLRQHLIACRCFAGLILSVCLKGMLYSSEVLLPGEVHLSYLCHRCWFCLGFFGAFCCPPLPSPSETDS